METIKTFHLEDVRYAEIKFSTSGKFLILFDYVKQIGKLFKSTNIFQCFDDIINDNYLIDFHIKEKGIEFGKIYKIIYD